MASVPRQKNDLGKKMQKCLLALFCVAMAATLALDPGPSSSQTALTPPLAQVHPLPQTLAQWNETQNGQGDYFDQIKPSRPGFLVWSHWPVQVYIAPPPKGALIKPEAWHNAILQAVQDWQPYLPLSLVVSPVDADITISANPPQQRSGARVRSAETRFELYLKGDSAAPRVRTAPSARPILAHRISIYIRPNQTIPYVSAAARHELGHGLGIWGHSQTPVDVMYFAQVRNPPAISARDINTLKRIYQQPTQLGWPIPGDKPEKNSSLTAE
jgi:predicted Zn-dependent protease